MPEQACLVLARLAGTKLNTALVKAFVNAISFFPLGSVVRTDRDEIGVVVRTTNGEPLHPVIALIGADRQRLPDEIDTSRRLLSGRSERHVVERCDRPRGWPQLVPDGVVTALQGVRTTPPFRVQLPVVLGFPSKALGTHRRWTVKKPVLVSLTAMLLAGSVAATDVSGVWSLRLTTNDGESAPARSVTLKQDGDRLTGSRHRRHRTGIHRCRSGD